MIELSTIMPRTTISAASVTVLSSMPNKYISPSVMAVQIGTPEPATSAVRNGKSRSITAITTSIDSTRSRRKEITDLLTTLGWSVMRCMFTSGGSSWRISSRMFSTFSPKATMLLPAHISIDIITQLLPLYSM